MKSGSPLWLGDSLGASCSTIESLELVGLRRRTGRIQVKTSAEIYSIYVDSGHIIHASSTDKGLRLGLMLLKHGYLESPELETALRIRGTEPARHSLGKQLVTDGFLTRADLATGVETQCVEILAHALDEEDATILFAEDQPLQLDLEIVPLNTDHLLLRAEGRQSQRTGWRAMNRLLPRPGSRLHLTSPILPLAAKLTNQELLVAMTVDRGTTLVDQLLSAVPLGELTIKRSLIGLLEQGILAVADHPTEFSHLSDEAPI